MSTSKVPQIIPRPGRILVKELKRDDVSSSSGVLLAGQTLQAENLVYGEIINHVPMDKNQEKLKPKMRIFYSKYSATSVRDNHGEEFFIVSDLDIQATEEA